MAELTTTPKAIAFRDQGYLAEGISASEKTAVVEAIFKYPSGVKTKQGFDTGAGFGVFELGGQFERFSFGGSSVDATTKRTTLSDIRRGLSQTDTTGDISEGTGLPWGANTKVIVSNDPYFFQQMASLDVANIFTAANTFNDDVTVNASVKMATTTGWFQPPAMTTAQREALSIPSGQSAIVYDTDLGVNYQNVNGAWGAVDNGTPATNATESAAGLVELATLAEHDPATSGARVVQAKNVITDPVTYTPAYLTLGTSAETNYVLWAAVTNASFRATIDGTAYNFDAIDFTGDASMADVAATLQTKIRAVTSGTETVTWDTDHFVITSGDTTSSSEVSVLLTSTGTVGIDISGAGASDWMDGDVSNGVATATVLNQAADEHKIPKLDDEGKVNREFIPTAFSPIGSGCEWYTDTAPTDYLLQDGSAYDASANPQYQALYDVIGNTFGGSDNTDFQVPDRRERVAVGKGSSGRLTSGNGHDASAIGNTFGAEVHTLTIDEMPSHRHEIKGYNQTSNGSGNVAVNNGGSITNHSQYAGGGDEHENVQPTLVVNFIIRYQQSSMLKESRLIHRTLTNAQLRGAQRASGRDPSTLTAQGKSALNTANSLEKSGRTATQILKDRGAVGTNISQSHVNRNYTATNTPLIGGNSYQGNRGGTPVAQPTSGQNYVPNPTNRTNPYNNPAYNAPSAITPRQGGFTGNYNPSDKINSRRAEERSRMQNKQHMAQFTQVDPNGQSLKTLLDDGVQEWAKTRGIDLGDKVFKINDKEMVDLGQISQRDFQDLIRTRRALNGLDTSNQDRLIGMFDEAQYEVSQPDFDANAPDNPLKYGSRNIYDIPQDVPQVMQGRDANETMQSIIDRVDFLRQRRDESAVGGRTDRNAVLEAHDEVQQGRRLLEEQSRTPEFQAQVMEERGWVREDGSDPFLDYDVEGQPFGFDMRNNLLVDREGRMTGNKGQKFSMIPVKYGSAKIWFYDKDGKNVIGTRNVHKGDGASHKMDFRDYLRDAMDTTASKGFNENYAKATELYNKIAQDRTDFDQLQEGTYIRHEDRATLDALDEEAQQGQSELNQLGQQQDDQRDVQFQDNENATASAYAMQRYQSPEFDYQQTKGDLDGLNQEMSAGSKHIYNAYLPQINNLRRSANFAEAQRDYEMSQLTPEYQIENQYNQDKFDTLQRTQRQEDLAKEKLRIQNESARIRKESAEADKELFEIQQKRRENEAREQNIQNEISNRRATNRLGIASDSNGLQWMQREVRKGNEFVAMLETMGDIQSAKFNRQIVDQYTNEVDSNFFNYETRMQEIDTWYEDKMSGFRKIINQEKKEVKAEKKTIMKEYFKRVNDADTKMAEVIGSMNIAMLNQFNHEEDKRFQREMKEKDFAWQKYQSDRDYAMKERQFGLQEKKFSYDQQAALQKAYNDAIVPYEETSKEQDRLFQRVQAMPSVKNYNEASRQLGQMESAFQAYAVDGTQNTANAVDQALAVTFQKMLDPTSVVRESEFARSIVASGAYNRLEASMQSIMKGGVLEDDTRADLVNMARRLQTVYQSRMLTEVEPLINQVHQWNSQPMLSKQITLDSFLPRDVVDSLFTEDQVEYLENFEAQLPTIGDPQNLPADHTPQQTAVLDGVVHYGSSIHADGLDISAASGTPIKAHRGGVVTDVVNEFEAGKVNDMEYGAKQNGGWGNQVKIKFDDGTEGWFNHLALSEQPLVAGTPISAGQTIGQVGNTGKTLGKNGYHLDLTMYDSQGERMNARQVATQIGMGAPQVTAPQYNYGGGSIYEQLAQAGAQTQPNAQQLIAADAQVNQASPVSFLNVDISPAMQNYGQFGLMTPEMKEMAAIEEAQEIEEFNNTFAVSDKHISQYAHNKQFGTNLIKPPSRKYGSGEDIKAWDRDISHLKALKSMASQNLPPREAFRERADGSRISNSQAKKDYNTALEAEMKRLAQYTREQQVSLAREEQLRNDGVDIDNTTLLSDTYLRS